jgi:ABC-2 type transport system ATP-binding protein
VVGLLGANGAGKSTTIRMITGFVPPDTGGILVRGHDTILDSIQARRSIGYLPESAPAYPEMTTRGYLDFRGRLHQMDRRARRERIEFVMDRCELAEVRDRRIGHLSKGYRQRVGLAAAMLHDPPVLVLDEPTNALDPRQIRHTRRLVRELARDKTVLVSSHVLPEVERTCDRVVIMAHGRVVADARPGELIERVRASAPYIAHIRGEEDAALVSVLSVPGIERVERDPPTPGRLPPPAGATAIQIVPKPGAPDLRELIAIALTTAGLELIEADVEGRATDGGGEAAA